MKKTEAIDQVTVNADGVVSARKITTIHDGDAVVSSSIHRYVLRPGQDISTQPEHVQAICNATWTSEIIAAYQVAIQE
jgi:hypothetical protein